jgi:glucan phosphoethanolaminetransferase (alkaline phosphatase superfamily)
MPITWILIAVALIAVIIVSKVIHFRHIKHRISAILIILLVVFLYATFTAVIRSNNLDIKSVSGILSAGKVYFSWLVQAVGNIKSLTGNAIKMDWMPANVSISSNIG